MARSCGIRIGPRRFELVVLDGTSKKHRISAYQSGELSEDPEEARAALVAAVKACSVPADNTAVAIDTGLAAFRTLKLPFSDRGKIEEVIKFEVESQLPQWDIDSVVVDFLVQEHTENESSLLVSAVPKAELSRIIDLSARAGVEPSEIDLEALAMVNAAVQAGHCGTDEAKVLVHIGESSTSVVVLDGGTVRALRAIHMGAFAQGRSVEAPAEAAEAEKRAPAEAEPTGAEDAEALERHQRNAASRIRRELGRTVSGARTAHPISAILVCGFELPDLIDSNVLDVPIQSLGVFDAEIGGPSEGAALYVVAYGAALRQLGALHVGGSLRREELKFTGTLERIEMPLALAGLLLATVAVIFCLFEYLRLQGRRTDLDAWRQSANSFMLGVPSKGVAGNLANPPKEITDFVARCDDPEATIEFDRLQQMEWVKGWLEQKVKKLDEQLGNSGEITFPQSSLVAATLVLQTMEKSRDRLGRFTLRQVDGSYQLGRAGESDTAKVVMNLSFFGDSGLQATQNLEELSRSLRDQPWCKEVDAKGSKEFGEEAPEQGVFVDGYTVVCDLAKLEAARLEAQ